MQLKLRGKEQDVGLICHEAMYKKLNNNIKYGCHGFSANNRSISLPTKMIRRISHYRTKNNEVSFKERKGIW